MQMHYECATTLALNALFAELANNAAKCNSTRCRCEQLQLYCGALIKTCVFQNVALHYSATGLK
jgi:hypothetical protein